MKSKDAIERLRTAERSIRALGVAHLFVFGSTSQNAAGDASDIDIFFDREPDASIGLMELAGLGRMLEDVVGTRVDVGTRKGLHPLIRAEVESSAIQVF